MINEFLFRHFSSIYPHITPHMPPIVEQRLASAFGKELTNNKTALASNLETFGGDLPDWGIGARFHHDRIPYAPHQHTITKGPFFGIYYPLTQSFLISNMLIIILLS